MLEEFFPPFERLGNIINTRNKLALFRQGKKAQEGGFNVFLLL
jgi:hypothetical protein